MIEDNNRKGPGIFYAVVGVATLVVAIIGATFAYFSASAQDAAAITGNTAEAGGLTLTVTPVGNTSSNMIPVNFVTGSTDTADQFAAALGTTEGEQCKDLRGSNVCQIYSINIKNKSTTNAVQVRGTLNLASDAVNMKWQLLSDSTSTTRAGFATVVDKGVTGDITVAGNVVSPATTGTGAASQDLAASGQATYYIVVWLEETGAAQENSDEKKNYTGTVKFDAVNAAGQSSGVTATFTA